MQNQNQAVLPILEPAEDVRSVETQRPAEQPRRWNQEEETHQIERQRMEQERSQDRLRFLTSGAEMKKLVL